MLAMLLEITSTLSCCALMPVAAMVRALMVQKTSNRHPADFLIRGDDLVPHCDRGLKRPLRGQDGVHHLLHRRLALDAGDRCGLTGLEGAGRVRGDLRQHLREVGALRASNGSWHQGAGAARERADGAGRGDTGSGRWTRIEDSWV